MGIFKKKKYHILGGNGSFDTQYYIMMSLSCDLLDSTQLYINTSHFCHVAMTRLSPLISELKPPLLLLPTAGKKTFEKTNCFQRYIDHSFDRCRKSVLKLKSADIFKKKLRWRLVSKLYNLIYYFYVFTIQCTFVILF